MLWSFLIDNDLILQVPASTHYSMVFYFVMKDLVPGSLLQRFVDGDDEFRNSRLKLIPSVPKVYVSFSLHCGSITYISGLIISSVICCPHEWMKACVRSTCIPCRNGTMWVKPIFVFTCTLLGCLFNKVSLSNTSHTAFWLDKRSWGIQLSFQDSFDFNDFSFG